jgi:hypothetical protein
MRWAGHVAHMGERRGFGGQTWRDNLENLRVMRGKHSKVSLKKPVERVWAGLFWLRTVTSGQPCWTGQWTFGFHKTRNISWLVDELSASRGHRCLCELRIVRLCSCNFIQTSYIYTAAETCRSITYVKTWVSNQMPAATFINCVYTRYYKNYTIPKAVRYYHLMSPPPRVRAANQPTIRGVAVCHKNWRPMLQSRQKCCATYVIDCLHSKLVYGIKYTCNSFRPVTFTLKMFNYDSIIVYKAIICSVVAVVRLELYYQQEAQNNSLW